MAGFVWNVNMPRVGMHVAFSLAGRDVRKLFLVLAGLEWGQTVLRILGLKEMLAVVFDQLPPQSNYYLKNRKIVTITYE